MEFKYEWRVRKYRSGSVEYKYMVPLLRGEHRPVITVYPENTAGNIYATAISGYTRRFDDLDAAMAYCANVPDPVGFIRN